LLMIWLIVRLLWLILFVLSWIVGLVVRDANSDDIADDYANGADDCSANDCGAFCLFHGCADGTVDSFEIHVDRNFVVLIDLDMSEFFVHDVVLLILKVQLLRVHLR